MKSKKKIYFERSNLSGSWCYAHMQQIRKILGFIRWEYIFTDSIEESDYSIVLSCIVVPLYVSMDIEILKYILEKSSGITIFYWCLNWKIRKQFEDEFWDKIIIITHEESEKFNHIFTDIKQDYSTSTEYNWEIWVLDENSVSFDEFMWSARHIVVNKGCKHNCAFCIIREGKKIKSYPFFQVLEEVKNKLEAGISHFRITSDDLSTYWIDTKQNLITLLHLILKVSDDITLEIGPIYPSYILENKSDFIQLFKTGKVTQIFSAIQHREQRILKLMDRWDYNHDEFERLILVFKEVFPKIIFSTHLIYGFPYETDEEFYSNLKNVQIFDVIQLYSYQENSKTQKKWLKNVDKNTIWERRDFIVKNIPKISHLSLIEETRKLIIHNYKMDTSLTASEKYF